MNVNNQPSLSIITMNPNDTFLKDLYYKTWKNDTLPKGVKLIEFTLEDSWQSKADIEAQLQSYFRGITPFVDGVDAPIDRNDLITDLTVSDVVQDVLKANGGSANSVAFDIVLGGSISEFQLGQGETAKLSDTNGVTYVT